MKTATRYHVTAIVLFSAAIMMVIVPSMMHLDRSTTRELVTALLIGFGCVFNAVGWQKTSAQANA